ncbi:MAG: hypothetical protein IKJ67_01055 [Bacteroidales bacterium]|nr:hypothetical protein [Bacteroidales bacterium]
MKKIILKLALIAVATAGMFSIGSCEKEKENSDEQKVVTVSNITYTDCLSESKDTFSKDISDSDSIVYYYQNHTLYITHYNLVIGCGEELHVDVQLINDTIRISEWTDGYVDCICKIDNSFQINNLTKGSYILDFVNPGIVLPINL